MLQRVREPLLHDPVRRPADMVREVAGGIDVQVDRRPQYAGHFAQVLQRLVRAGSDDLRGPSDLLSGCIRPVRQRSRVHAEQRQPVPQYIVHLADDLFSRAQLGLLGLQLGDGLGPIGDSEDQQRGPPRLVDGHRQNQQEGRAAGGLREDGHRRRDDGQLDRPATPEPDGEAERHPAIEVRCEHEPDALSLVPWSYRIRPLRPRQRRPGCPPPIRGLRVAHVGDRPCG